MADYTRDTFRPSRHFSGVRQQQGRVHLDADWNEAFDIGRHVERTTTGDVIGQTGMPGAAAGFALSAVPAAPGADLLIGPGRAYVDGILVEHEAGPAGVLHRVSGVDAATLWEVVGGPALRLGQWVETIAAGAATRVSVTAIKAPEEGDGGRQRLTLSGAVSAADSVEIRALASLLVQPHLPGAVLPAEPVSYLAYLEVWEREITALDDPLIAETALNGPDTAVRSQVVWQVRTAPVQQLIDAGAVAAPVSCSSFPPGWTPEVGAPLRLSAAVREAAAEQSPCELPVEGGYRSLDNQLYRVEIHNGGAAGAAGITLKWSRDNAIHRHRLLDVANSSLVLEEIGPDSPTSIAADDWLELVDEERALNGAPGYFIEVDEVVGTRLGIRTILDPETLQPLVQNGEPNADILPRRGMVRRWEGGPPVAIPADGKLTLEAGIEVTISAGRAATGMYWLIPARTLTAALEWPADAASGAPLALPPHGIRRTYCALGLIDNSAGLSVVSDCRPLFEPLTELETFAYLGGDGQEAAPDLTAPATLVPLNSPLRVGVTRGRHPVAGRAVRFSLTEANSGASLVVPPGGSEIEHVATGAAMTTLVLRTDADGVAEAGLSIPGLAGQYHVIAELLDSTIVAGASVSHLPIVFTASASVAAAVAFDPANCAYQASERIAPAPSRTVQEAIDRLCPRVELQMAGGDSQLLSSQQQSLRPLRVGVYWGKQPLAGVPVDFAVSSGDATMSAPQALTNAEGIAESFIDAGSNTTANGGLVEITATVVGTPAPNPAPLVFGARFFKSDGAGGPTCSVTIGPDELRAAGTTLAKFVIELVSADPKRRVSITLLPGSYGLEQTLDLRRCHNLILAGCRDGVWLEPMEGDPRAFERGLVMVAETENLTLRRLGLLLPSGERAGPAQGIWVINSTDVRIEDCEIRLPKQSSFRTSQIGIRISGDCPDLRILGNRIAGDVPIDIGADIGRTFGIVAGVDRQLGNEKAEAASLTGLEVSRNELQHLTTAIYLRALLGRVRCDDNRVSDCENGVFIVAASVLEREVLFDALERDGRVPDGRLVLAAFQGAHPALMQSVQEILAAAPLPSDVTLSNAGTFGEPRIAARALQARVAEARALNTALRERFDADPPLSRETQEQLVATVATLPSRDRLEAMFKALAVSKFRLSNDRFPTAATVRASGNSIETLPNERGETVQAINSNLLIYLDQSTAPTVTVTGNTIRGQRPAYLVWIKGGSYGSVTGNTIINVPGQIKDPWGLYYMLNVEQVPRIVSIAGNAIAGAVSALTPRQANSDAQSWRHLNSYV